MWPAFNPDRTEEIIGEPITLSYGSICFGEFGIKDDSRLFDDSQLIKHQGQAVIGANGFCPNSSVFRRNNEIINVALINDNGKKKL